MLTDIPATAVGTDGVVVLQQEYSTHFTSMANRTFRTKSGNPGYIFGRRLAVGTLQITATGLEFSDLGVLGSIEDGACTNTMKNMVHNYVKCSCQVSATGKLWLECSLWLLA